MVKNKLYGESFNGYEASDYAKERGYLDYRCLAANIDMIQNEAIIRMAEDLELVNGNDVTDDGDMIEIFQYFLINERDAEMLSELTDEIIYYSNTYDLYIWGITHLGTSWDYVLTDIKLNCGDEAFE